MRKECWALLTKNGGLHRSVDFEYYEPILPKLFRTRKQAEEYRKTNVYYHNHEPIKIIIRIDKG